MYLWVPGTPLQFRQGEEGTEGIRIFSRKMGLSASKNRKMFIEILLHMLAHTGVKVSTGRLSKFLIFVQEQCPWFPEEDTINLEIWTKVGDQLHLCYTLHGPEKVPIDAFDLWNMIRNVLDPQHEAVRQPMGKATAVDGGYPPSAQIMFSATDKKKKKGGRLCSTSGGEGGLAGHCSWVPSSSTQTSTHSSGGVRSLFLYSNL